MAALQQISHHIPDLSDQGVKEAILNELERLKSHPLIRDTTRIKGFLDFIVREALDGRGNRLKGYTIGVAVFERPEGFDPQTDTIVRVQAGQLRRRMDLIYSQGPADSPVRILIPKGQYTPVFEIREPVTSEDVFLGQGNNGQSLLSPANDGKQAPLLRPGLAMMSLENHGVTPDRDFFAEGLTSEIINALVQFRYLRIVGLTPTVSDRADLKDIRQLRDKFDVDFVLSGTVRQSEDVFRITIHLLSTETGEHIFSKIWDRAYKAENIFDVQEEIASYTAAAIAAPYGAINRYNYRPDVKARRSIPAYEALLKYYALSLDPTPDEAEALLNEFTALNKSSPQVSSAWAVTALLHCFIYGQSFPLKNGKHHLRKAKMASRKATLVDPNNALGYFARFQSYYHAGDLKKSEAMAKRALELNPNDDAMLALYAVKQAFMGDCVKAGSCLSAALKLNPRPPRWFYFSALLCAFQAGEYEFAVEQVSEINEDASAATFMIWLSCLGHLGRADEAKDFIAAKLKDNPKFGRDCVKAMSYWHPNKDLLEKFLEGWRKVGLSPD